MKIRDKFWEKYKLEDLTRDEWELLCDKCGFCCSYKEYYSDINVLIYTDLACRQLNLENHQCKNYKLRFELEASCENFRDIINSTLYLYPDTCAYKLLSENKKIPYWHPLLTGSYENIVKIVREELRLNLISIDDISEDEKHLHIVKWVEYKK